MSDTEEENKSQYLQFDLQSPIPSQSKTQLSREKTFYEGIEIEDEKEKLIPQISIHKPETSSNIFNLDAELRTPDYKEPSSALESYEEFRNTPKKSMDNSLLISHLIEKDDRRPQLFARPDILLKKSEDIRQNHSIELDSAKSEIKDHFSMSGAKSAKDDQISISSDIPISQKRGPDGQSKRAFVKSSFQKKPVTISLPFDEYVDLVKRKEITTIVSNYPSFKIDKRLIFLGKEVDFPWHVISYHSYFRKVWNFLIVLLITYEIFWYPLAVVFLYDEPWPLETLIFEIFCVFLFLLDIVINFRTTYSNENNEEIIDGTMMKDNYMKNKLFLIDIIAVLPVPEILLLIMAKSPNQWVIYSMGVLVRMIRILKISTYLQDRTLSLFAKLLKLFITFFLFTHWLSCVWFIIIRAQFPDQPTVDNLWFPTNLRMIATDDDDLLAFYTQMSKFRVYSWNLLSLFMLAIGSDMAPLTTLQIGFTVMIGLFGSVGIAFIIATVTLNINRANSEKSAYQQHLEDLKYKLKVKKIPKNLKRKVMEYFYYSWRKDSVLKKMEDFSELSIPLQRDIALYQHQDMINKVPLFKDLDPVEKLSIVQKLKTAIYMPGDIIVREGERGTEMFFIQEGVAEMLIRKSNIKTAKNPKAIARYEKVVLEKGDYFGEVALMSNSKRTFDVSAFEFCILYTFSKLDYDNLKNEFKDIGPRLKSGLKHYKNTRMELIIQILKNLDIFEGFKDQELVRIADEYLEEVFVDPDKVVLAPKSRTNAIYIMFGGKVNCYANEEETRQYLSHLKRSNERENFTVVDIDSDEDIDCLDDDILKLEKDKLSMDDDKKRLDLLDTFNYGEYFGTLDFDVNEIKCDQYYVTDSGCRIGVITQVLKSQMAVEDPLLYEKLQTNVIKYSPKRSEMGAIEEESDSSFATSKKSTMIKARFNKRPSLTDLGKKPILLKASSLNQGKEDDIEMFKDELQTLEEEMLQFKGLISKINNKINKLALNNQNNQNVPGSEVLDSPEIPKTTNKGLAKILDHVKGLDKIEENKELARTLLGVYDDDEIIEEKKS